MGCCQGSSDPNELILSTLQDKIDEVTKGFVNDGFNDISLESRAIREKNEEDEEETSYLPRFTENFRSKEKIVVVRPTSYSLHRSEIEQSFLITKGSFLGKELE